MKKHKLLTFILITALLLSLCPTISLAAYRENLTIYYTGDIRGNIDGSLTYSKLAALYAGTSNAVLLDCGDHLSGSDYTSYDNGASIIKIMNAVGYSASVPGTSDLSSGVAAFQSNSEGADFPYLACNLFSSENGTRRGTTFSSYTSWIVSGDLRLAVIGVVSPNLITDSNRSLYVDGSGNLAYELSGDSGAAEFYADIQATVDEAKAALATFVVVISHLDSDSGDFSPEALISNTEKIDAVINSNSGTAVESLQYYNKNGSPVVLTSPGSNFEAIGEMTITPLGLVTTRLITDLKDVVPSKSVEKLENQLKKAVEKQAGATIASSETELVIEGKDGRMVRGMETSLGDFAADAIYYCANSTGAPGCDAAIINAGSIASGLQAGKLSLNSCKSVFAANDDICVVSMSGRQLSDALEWGTRMTTGEAGVNECSGFLQAAGMKYTVDTSMRTGVVGVNRFESAGEVSRVFNINIYNKVSGQYEPLESDRIYSVAGPASLLIGTQDGFSMFEGCTAVSTFLTTNYKALADYMVSFTGSDTLPVITSLNSSMMNYRDYGVNYENATGSGRILICSHPEDAIVYGTEIATCKGGFIGGTTCSICGRVLEEGVEAAYIPHNPSDPVFKWTSDLSACNASISCYNCGTLLLDNVPCALSKTVMTEASPEADGFVRITASFDYEGTTFSDSKPVVVRYEGNDTAAGMLNITEQNMYLYAAVGVSVLAMLLILIIICLKPRRRRR